VTTFADEAEIEARAGKGGNGAVHFRREKYVPMGGPDGGDGGRGGSIYFEADPSLNSLLPFVRRRRYAASPGKDGGGRQKHGAKGQDLVLRVPPGTIVRDATTGTVLADIVAPKRRTLICRGGRGGLGNTHFVTPVRQAPRVADRGEPGEQRSLALVLKLIAEVGIVGLPNAGKSTLLAALSAARPKIAGYPFTTLEPELGVAELDDRTIVIADIPGLIEGAHRGLGLGHTFLRHVERTRVLVHVVDGSGLEGRDPLDAYRIIQDELTAYSPALAARPQIVAINKLDLPETAQRLAEYRRSIGREGTLVLGISAATRQGVQELLRAVVKLLDAHQELEAAPPIIDPLQRFEYAEVKRDGQVFRATGSLVDRIVAMSDVDSSEGIERLRRRLVQIGVESAIFKQGAAHGDRLIVGPTTWRVSDARISFETPRDEEPD
jgi:GTP-binding protein